MKKRKSNRNINEVMVFPLSHIQRTALWITLDLLSFSKDNHDLSIIEPICRVLLSHDEEDGVYELELSSKAAILAASAVDAATLYLDGFHPYFEDPSSEFLRLISELQKHSPVVRNLRHSFQECVLYLQSLQ